MNWLPLDSSALKAVAYLPAKRLLYLEFESGERYRYFEFPPERYQDFLAAESKGTYFAQRIRNLFPYENFRIHAGQEDNLRLPSFLASFPSQHGLHRALTKVQWTK
jgi:hypothetical protein